MCARDVGDNTGLGHEEPPKAGDFSICLYCAALLRFAAGGGELQLVEATADELAELDVLDRGRLLMVRGAILRSRGSRPRAKA